MLGETKLEFPNTHATAMSEPIASTMRTFGIDFHLGLECV
jgi:hypothetical protein